MVGQPEMFGHNAKDGFLVPPLAKASAFWILMGVEPDASRHSFTSMTKLHYFSREKCIPLTLTVMFTGPR